MSLTDIVEKVRKDDRILVLKPMEGAKALDSKGFVDPRLFTGDNKLHAIKTPDSMWYMKYEQGLLPPLLKEQRYTSFSKLYKAAESYFNTRNIQITEIID